MPPADDLVEVHVTTPDRGVAMRLVRLLVERSLAACVQVVPGVTSVFAWEGAVEEDEEHLLLVKSTARRLGPIRDLVHAEHPYDTPEVLAVAVADCDPRYADWLRETVRTARRDVAAKDV